MPSERPYDTWIVKIPEVWIQEYLVDAETREQALKDAPLLGRLLENHFEFSHVMQPEWWDVEPYSENK